MIEHAKRRLDDTAFLFGGAVISVLLLASASSFHIYTEKQTELDRKKTATIFNQQAFESVSIVGKSYVVYDIVGKNVIAEKNSTQMLPLASLTKIMTSVTARLHYTKDTVLTIHPSSIEGSYDLGLRKGQVWKLNELLKYMLVFSSNDAAYVVADTFGGREEFIAQMNRDASRLGLALTFTNPSGLDEGGKLGGEGSALEVAKLLALARVYFPELYDVTTKERTYVTASTGRLTGLPNTNQDIGHYFGAEISKTGYTDEAGGNLGIITDIALGHPVAIVVLGSTREERFNDVKKLYETLIVSMQTKE